MLASCILIRVSDDKATLSYPLSAWERDVSCADVDTFTRGSVHVGFRAFWQKLKGSLFWSGAATLIFFGDVLSPPLPLVPEPHFPKMKVTILTVLLLMTSLIFLSKISVAGNLFHIMLRFFSSVRFMKYYMSAWIRLKPISAILSLIVMAGS